MDRFSRGSLTFDVRDAGPSDGDPVVLLHGFPQDKRSWAAMEPFLHEAGLRTLAPDQRGYSPGARPTGRRNYAGHHLADDIAALLDAAELESAHIVGHDWGGGVAWGFADRHAARTRTVTSITTPHPQAMVRQGFHGQFLKSWYMGAFQLPWLPEAFIGVGIRRGKLAENLVKSGLPAESAAHNERIMAAPGVLTAAIHWYRGLPFSLRHPVGKITVPTTYVWANRDPFLGRAAAQDTANWVTGDYRYVELDAGHFVPETHPEPCAQAVIERVQSVRAAA